MTLGNMRANGVVSCWLCHHQAVVSADSWPDDMPVPAFGPRMVCTRCGIIGADARPNWREQPARLSGAGTAPCDERRAASASGTWCCKISPRSCRCCGGNE
jgi:hypothetical protein